MDHIARVVEVTVEGGAGLREWLEAVLGLEAGSGGLRTRYGIWWCVWLAEDAEVKALDCGGRGCAGGPV